MILFFQFAISVNLSQNVIFMSSLFTVLGQCDCHDSVLSSWYCQAETSRWEALPFTSYYNKEWNACIQNEQCFPLFSVDEKRKAKSTPSILAEIVKEEGLWVKKLHFISIVGCLVSVCQTCPFVYLGKKDHKFTPCVYLAQDRCRHYM